MLAGLMAAAVIAAPHAAATTDGRHHLVYEIELGASTALERVVVLDPDRHAALATFGGRALKARVRDGVLYLDVPVRRVPGRLAHRLTHNGHAVVTARTRVFAETPVRVRPPLGIARLVDVNGCCAVGEHTTALQLIDGRAVNAQRFAIDFLRLNAAGDDTATGDRSRNESYAIYGATVLAAAPGTIVAVVNDMAENTPGAEPPPNLQTAAGNRIVEDLGGGRFALYAHLRTGSVGVAPGQHVEAGELLAQVGNSGNSTEPHLHFHVMDGPGGATALGANGLPYAFTRFTLTGHIPDFSKPELVPAKRPHRRDQLPLQGDVLAF